jgi:hypothetical protein
MSSSSPLREVMDLELSLPNDVLRRAAGGAHGQAVDRAHR